MWWITSGAISIIGIVIDVVIECALCKCREGAECSHLFYQPVLLVGLPIRHIIAFDDPVCSHCDSVPDRLRRKCVYNAAQERCLWLCVVEWQAEEMHSRTRACDSKELVVGGETHRWR